MIFSRWWMLGVLFAVRFALGFQFQSAGSVEDASGIVSLMS